MTATGTPTPPFAFFLGGRDLEMVTIAELLRAHVPPERIHDAGLGWGAKASAYRGAIAAALDAGLRPVLVELEPDLPLSPQAVVVVDHHGPKAGADAPTALEQVFDLLALPPSAWERRHALVAANERGHVRALRAMGATPEEIAAIRRADQGVTEAQEAAGDEALRGAEERLDGRVLLVRLPHGRTAVITDRLTDGADRTLVVLSPGEVNVFAPGPAILALDHAFPGGWSGGALPDHGFWGHGEPLMDEAALLAVLGFAL